ncbi:MAG: hypothetical protein MR418_05535 [Clostridiales bacterium]|nr:hypothetical protein [Clostridiales bacterium]
MEISNEMLAKAKEAKTYDELKTLADANGVEMTEEDAKAYFSKLHPQSGALADDELDYVAGGCGGYGKPKPRYNIGQRVIFIGMWFGSYQLKNDGKILSRSFENGDWVYTINAYAEIVKVMEAHICGLF